MTDQLDQLESEIARAVAAARKAGGPGAAQARVQRRVAALGHARQLYLNARNQALYKCAQAEDQIATLVQTLQKVRTELSDAEQHLTAMPDVFDPRPGLRERLAWAEQEYDRLTRELAEARAALNAVAPYWPPEEQFAPPDRMVLELGIPHYFCGTTEVQKDGSPLPHG